MRAKHSSHTFISVTGGLLGVRRAGTPDSAPTWSSAHISARSSDISTNSKSRTFLTTFGGSAAAGLYGPDPDRGGDPICDWDISGWVCFPAVAARPSRPVAIRDVVEKNWHELQASGVRHCPSCCNCGYRGDSVKYVIATQCNLCAPSLCLDNVPVPL